jgi:hypothetical protein
MGTQNNTDIIGSCIASKSTVSAGINSTTMNIDRFTRMNTPDFYMRQNVVLFLDKWVFIQKNSRTLRKADRIRKNRNLLKAE